MLRFFNIGFMLLFLTFYSLYNDFLAFFTLLVGICNALDVTMDYLLENEYHTPTSVAEKELFNVIKDMEPHKLETLLKIAKVL